MKKYVIKNWSLYVLNDQFSYQDKEGCHSDFLYRKLFGFSKHRNFGISCQI